MKKEQHKKLEKYLNLLTQGKCDGYLVIGINEKKKYNLNTFGFIRGNFSPNWIIKGVIDFLIKGGLIKKEFGKSFHLVYRDLEGENPTGTSSNPDYQIEFN